MKKWPTPFNQPLIPFFIAGGLVFYGVYRMADAMMQSEPYINDPRNPRGIYSYFIFYIKTYSFL
ncbi:hypothetical protein PNEG_00863 [Pneumocystis murina B123]|uniref:ATP synthase subunit J, mitochondrial n=1 Tax=Pneumocystis murina (strain B123) TaxID=1069680 RepID=M7NPS8_PNEMU|nr:hypothetical protein PNEG_00863 [Pneumocystis murina B123]EMR10713.1 hypothetical protein PNEG_00863 [Pneumocystis murina B123]